MFYERLIFLLLLASAEEITKSLNELSLLQCLMEENNEPCSIQPGQGFYENISLFSPQLLQDFSKLDIALKKAIRDKNFNILDENNFEKVPGGIILLLPACHLKDLSGSVLSSLVHQWKKHEVICKHLVKAFLDSSSSDAFIYMLQSSDFGTDSLRWTADVASFSNRAEAHNIVGRFPLLFYSPPESIILYRRPESFFSLSYWDTPDDLQIISSNKAVLRFWAYSMITNEFPESLKNWNTFYVDRWGFFLTGATIDELNQLDTDNVDNLSTLFSFNFTAVQMRALFDKFYFDRDIRKEDFYVLSHAVKYLLPSQLRRFTVEIGDSFSTLTPADNAYASSRQIFELIRANSFLKPQLKLYNYPINNFVSCLPLNIFKNVLTEHMNKTSIFQIQSTHLTKSQMYYLTLKENIFDIESGDIFRCSEYVEVLPANDIIFSNSTLNASLHILSKVDADNIPQTFAALNKIWSELGSVPVFQKILNNSRSMDILENIPSRCFMDSHDKLLPTIIFDAHKKLPNKFIATINKRLKENSPNFKYSSVNESLAFLYISITCDDISLVDPYDFIMFLSNYNNYMKISGKMIPKNVQQCCIHKLLEVLQLKSVLTQTTLYGSKLSLLNEAEIDTIGGYILSGLTPVSISRSRRIRSITKVIGKLSLWELLSAVPIGHLQKLSSILAETISPIENISFSLFDFGNLTLFLETKYLEKINKDYFKLFLEGNYIDHRVCANQSTRSSWYSFIKRIFGEPDKWSYQTVASLGDFLIVVPEEDLMKIEDNVWIYAADSLVTRYFDTEFVTYSKLKFYEVCLAQLNNIEKSLYIDDLKKLVTALVRAAQLQIKTIEIAETFIGNNKTNGNLVDSNIETTVIYPSTASTAVRNYTHTLLATDMPYTSIEYMKSNISKPVVTTSATKILSTKSTIYEEDIVTIDKYFNMSKMNTSPIPYKNEKSLSTTLEIDTTTEEATESSEMTFMDLSPFTKGTLFSEMPSESSSDVTDKHMLTSKNDRDQNMEDEKDISQHIEDMINEGNHNYTTSFRSHADIIQLDALENHGEKSIPNTQPIENHNSIISESDDAGTNNGKVPKKLIAGEVKHFQEISKRSIEEKWSCEALKMVGKSVEIILTERIIHNLDDEDLINCVDLFADLDLTSPAKAMIWRRINADNFITFGKLVSVANVSDLLMQNFSLVNRWSLENIYLLGKYNVNPTVRNHIINEVWKTIQNSFSAELVVSLGSLICDLPYLNSDVIEPSVFFKSSVILGKSLSCNNTCLSRLASLAVHQDAFGDPSTWTFGDVHDLGIIVSGLNFSGWKTLIRRNSEAITGLTEAAFSCLPYNYVKMMRKIPIEILPETISKRFLEYDTHNKLKNFDFYYPKNSQKSSSFTKSPFTFNQYILMICIMLFIT